MIIIDIHSYVCNPKPAAFIQASYDFYDTAANL